jgi:hypothetical protein
MQKNLNKDGLVAKFLSNFENKYIEQKSSGNDQFLKELQSKIFFIFLILNLYFKF